MEREHILTLISPVDASQPLLTPVVTIADNSDNQEVGIGLHTFSQIPAADMTDIYDSNDLPSSQSVVLLPTSGSIQADIIEPTESEDEKTDAEYQSLATDDEHAELYQFLESFGVTRQHIDQAQISQAALWRLYQQEFSCFSWIKWSSFDHAIEKHLQWLLLSLTDVGVETPQKCNIRVRPGERTILLKTTWGLIKAYAVRGFVQGVEMGLLELVHYFIYAMLAYRLGELAKTGQSDFEEFQAIFSGSSQKGIDSLVHSLARLEARWLKLILATPVILGVAQGIMRMRGARSISAEEIQKIAAQINTHLAKPSSIWRNIILEKIPLLSNLFSLGSQVQKLEQWVRWDGRLGRQSRQQGFELIRRVVWEGEKITQLNALDSLAKIAHGIGLKDLPRLRQAGYSPEELSGLIAIKATALADLIELSSSAVIEDNKAQFGKMKRLFISSPRRLYASYLLWWLGQSTSWWTQRLPFALLKIVKLGLEALFLQKIAASILEAIACPDKPGFQFGNGYQDWASDYTVTCFTTRINLFRTVEMNESVDVLVAEIPQYHLIDFITLDLSFKQLTTDESRKIITAVIKQGAKLTSLDLSVNDLNQVDETLFMNLIPLEYLYLSNNNLAMLDGNVFDNLKNLKYLDMSHNLLTTFGEGIFDNLGQMQELYLSSNRLISLDDNIFYYLTQLKKLNLGFNQLTTLEKGIFDSLEQLQELYLSFNQFMTLSGGVFDNLKQLQELYLSFNQLDILSGEIFGGLERLQILYLHGNKIKNLNHSTFSNLTQLLHLELNNNKLLNLNEGSFHNLKQIQTLSLSSNQLMNLSKSVFSGLKKLQFLYLNNNNLSRFENDTFIELGQLTSLNLANNAINSNAFNDIIFMLPVTLTDLDLSSNNIDFISENFSKRFSVSLKSFSIGDNPFVPNILTQAWMQYIPNSVTFLSLKNSNITNVISNAFTNSTILESLDLSFNNLFTLNAGIFEGLSQLTWLDLSGNQLTVLSSGIFDDLEQLQWLGLFNNELTTLNSGVFNSLSRLQILGLSGNQFVMLNNKTFIGLWQLQLLSLGYNKLTTLHGSTFDGLYQLRTLELSNNQLTTIPSGIFDDLTQLEYVDISFNRLINLSSDTFDGLEQKLQRLYLGYNLLMILNKGIFNKLTQLEVLVLNDNKLSDTAIENITKTGFPYQLSILYLNNNQISNVGFELLTQAIPCTNITRFDFDGNPANDTSLALAAQQNMLKKVCDDQRCHANLPISESCGVNTNPLITTQWTWKSLFGSTVEMDKTESNLPDYASWLYPTETPSFQSALALPSVTPESTLPSLTSTTAGAVILGVVGLSVLLCKNSTWIQAIIETGSHFSQRCWSSGKTEEIKMVSPASPSNRRYTVFPYLPTIFSRKNSSLTTTPSVVLS